MVETRSMTVRLDSDISDRFKEIAREKNISQGQLIEELVQIYEKKLLNNKDFLEQNNEENIKLLLKYENEFKNTEEGKYKKSKVFKFRGKQIYISQNRQLTDEAIVHLKEELGFDASEKNYFYNYLFGIFQDLDKNRLVISEWFLIGEVSTSKIMVNIRRCKLAANLEQIISELKFYAIGQEIDQIQYLLSEEIKDDEELDMYLF